jgi:hypothetical protein
VLGTAEGTGPEAPADATVGGADPAAGEIDGFGGARGGGVRRMVGDVCWTVRSSASWGFVPAPGSSRREAGGPASAVVVSSAPSSPGSSSTRRSPAVPVMVGASSSGKAAT